MHLASGLWPPPILGNCIRVGVQKGTHFNTYPLIRLNVEDVVAGLKQMTIKGN